MQNTSDVEELIMLRKQILYVELISFYVPSNSLLKCNKTQLRQVNYYSLK